MEAGVKDSDLRHRTQQFLDNLHAFEFGAVVERRKNRNAFDRRLDFGSHQRGLEMVWTTVDYAVPHYIDFGRIGNRLRLSGPQALEQGADGFPAGRHACQLFLSGNPSEILYRVLSLAIDPLDLAFPNAIWWIGWELISNFVETTLLAAGAGVENEHFH